MKNLLNDRLHRSNFKVMYLSRLGILSLVACLLILMVLGWLCREVWEREAFTFDTTLLLGLHHWASPQLDRLMLLVTRLGNPPTVIGVVGGTLLWLARKRFYQDAVFLVIACLGGAALNQGLKIFFAKPRPQLWPPLLQETSFSFPSGHALGSLVVYGFLAWTLARHFPKYSVWIYTLAALLITMIGLSRLYLGVHWPTDVIAGYGIGFFWLLTCMTLQKRYLL